MNRKNWIDVGKGIAIFGVILDHAVPSLDGDRFLQSVLYFSYYSVSLFIILAGVTTYISLENSIRSTFSFDYIFKKIKVVFIPYIIATIIYTIYRDLYFDFKTIINHLIYFDAAGPLYYIFLYLQLLCISPILYKIINILNNSNFSLLKHILFLGTIIIISIIFTKYTNILNIYGGGGKLLGGTFLALYYIGMLFANKTLHTPPKKAWLKSLILFTLFIILITTIIKTNQMVLDYNSFLLKTLNPANVTLSIYGLLIFFFIFYFFTTLEITNKFSMFISIFAWFGKYSLYIFLYHLLVRANLSPFIKALSVSPRIAVLIYIPCLLIVPIIFYKLFLKIRRLFRNIME